jgi:DNA ligase-1
MMQLLAETCEAVASTSGKNEKVEIVAAYLRSCPLRDAELAALYISGRVFPAYDERTLQVGGALRWRVVAETAGSNDAKLALAFRKYGDLGSAAGEVLASRSEPPANTAGQPLALSEVADFFGRIAEVRGPAAKHALLRELLARASALEAKYLIKIMSGELRIGFKESLVEEAIAKAWGASVETVKRANMLLGDLSETLRLTSEGRADEARMRLFHPIGFMLACPAASAEEAFPEFPEMVVEDKYDGIRAQAHCSGGVVRLFSRTLDNVTGAFPELVPSLAAIPEDVILDGEILGWDFSRNGGSARAFSELQKRLGRKRVTAAIMREVPVAYVVFDVLYAGHELLLERPLRERAAVLDALFTRLRHPLDPESEAQGMLSFDAESDLPATSRVLRAPSTRATSALHLDELFEQAQARGNEGLMIKDAASSYTPGRRGQSWLKLKRELATLDVVVTSVEFGHGKRAGVLSDYTFAVRDGERLLNIGKAYSGLTDAEIATLTEWFREHTLADHGHWREVEPVMVVEVAFNAVMRSERHASGFALRFPRIVRLRQDKPVSEIDTLQRVEEIYSQQIHLQKTA